MAADAAPVLMFSFNLFVRHRQSSPYGKLYSVGNMLAFNSKQTFWSKCVTRAGWQAVGCGRCVYRDSFRLCIHKREKKKNQTTTLLTCNQEKGGLWLFKLDVNRVKYKIDKNTHQMKMKAISNPEAIKDAGDLCAPGKEIINSYIISTFQLVYTIHVYCISPPDICV